MVAGPLDPCVESVVRVTVEPLTMIWAVAFAVKVPTELLLIVNVHVAVVAVSVGEPHVSDCEPGAGVTDVVIVPNVEPAGAFTVIVNVCACPTSFVPFGVI